MNALREDAFVFSKPDVATKLGVGKNMASSIRYWCQATGMVSFQGKEGKLTNLGELIFGSNVNLQMIDKKTRLPPPTLRRNALLRPSRLENLRPDFID